MVLSRSAIRSVSSTVPLLLKTGLTIEQIAQQLKVEIEAVRRAAQDQA